MARPYKTSLEKALHACIDLDEIVDSYQSLQVAGIENSYIAKHDNLLDLCYFASQLADMLADLVDEALENGDIITGENEE